MQYIEAPDNATNSDWNRLEEENRNEQRLDLRRAWETMASARDRAEVLLPPDVFAPFEAVFCAYSLAREKQYWMDFPTASMKPEEAGAARNKYLRDAAAARPAALEAFQRLIGTADPR